MKTDDNFTVDYFTMELGFYIDFALPPCGKNTLNQFMDVVNKP